MSKTANEIWMEKLRSWEIREEANMHDSEKAWLFCGVSLGVGLLLYPVLYKFGWEIGVLFAAVCGHIFVFNIVRLLRLEKEQQQIRDELDLLLNSRNV